MMACVVKVAFKDFMGKLVMRLAQTTALADVTRRLASAMPVPQAQQGNFAKSDATTGARLAYSSTWAPRPENQGTRKKIVSHAPPMMLQSWRRRVVPLSASASRAPTVTMRTPLALARSQVMSSWSPSC